MGPIERVARAISQARGEAPDELVPNGNGQRRWELHAQDARVAVLEIVSISEEPKVYIPVEEQ